MSETHHPSEENPAAERPWYADGLCFTCTGCGDCCRHDEGHVWIDRSDVGAIAAFLGLDEEVFSGRYVRRIGRRLSLIEKPNLDCIFWENGCSIYPVRPTQCRTFPFWPENIETEEDWAEIYDTCPGTGSGRRYGVDEIVRLAGGEGETGPSVVTDGEDRA